MTLGVNLTLRLSLSKAVPSFFVLGRIADIQRLPAELREERSQSRLWRSEL